MSVCFQPYPIGHPVDGENTILPDVIMSNDNLIEEVFGTNEEDYVADIIVDKSILTPKSDHTIRLNKDTPSRVHGQEQIYLSAASVDSKEGEDAKVYTTEFLITVFSMPRHRLHLKIDRTVVLLRNISPANGLCNGAGLKIIPCRSRIQIKISSLHLPEKRIILARIELAPSDNTAPFTLRRRHFPVRLAYAMTINKSHGQTFDRIGIYLLGPVFTHGQLHVALSTVRNQNDVKVQLIPTS